MAPTNRTSHGRGHLSAFIQADGTLDLARHSISEEMIRPLCHLIERRLDVCTVILSHCGLWSQDVAQIARAISNNPSITSFDLSHNLVTEEGCGELLECLRWTQVSYLNVSDNPLGEAGVRSLTELAESNQSLQQVCALCVHCPRREVQRLEKRLRVNREASSKPKEVSPKLDDVDSAADDDVPKALTAGALERFNTQAASEGGAPPIHGYIHVGDTTPTHSETETEKEWNLLSEPSCVTNSDMTVVSLRPMRGSLLRPSFGLWSDLSSSATSTDEYLDVWSDNESTGMKSLTSESGGWEDVFIATSKKSVQASPEKDTTSTTSQFSLVSVACSSSSFEML